MHLRRSLPLLLLVALGCGRGRDTPGPIFREITVGTGQKLALGAPIPADVMPLLELQAERLLRFREGTIGDAASIVVALAPDGRVRSIDFLYAPGTDYAAKVAGYVEDLGPPAWAGPAGAMQVTRWEDPRTRFEVFTQNPVVGSRLLDRALSPPPPNGDRR
jgi:hypothetical protein